MAGSVNKVILVGNLGQDPDSRSFQNGGKVVNLSLATSESWKDRNSGEKREKTEWHRIAIFNEGIANFVEQYARKGSKVYVEGQLQTRKWQDQQGNDRFSTEVVLQGFNAKLVLLSDPPGGRSDRDDRGNSDFGGGGAGRSGGGSRGGGGGGFGGGFADDLDDDVPF